MQTGYLEERAQTEGKVAGAGRGGLWVAKREGRLKGPGTWVFTFALKNKRGPSEEETNSKQWCLSQKEDGGHDVVRSKLQSRSWREMLLRRQRTAPQRADEVHPGRQACRHQGTPAWGTGPWCSFMHGAETVARCHGPGTEQRPLETTVSICTQHLQPTQRFTCQAQTLPTSTWGLGFLMMGETGLQVLSLKGLPIPFPLPQPHPPEPRCCAGSNVHVQHSKKKSCCVLYFYWGLRGEAKTHHRKCRLFLKSIGL